MNLTPFAEYLEVEGIACPGDDLFTNFMPSDAPVKPTALLRSPLSGTSINQYLPNYRRGSFQLVVRTPKNAYSDGLDFIEAITTALSFTERQTIGSSVVYNVKQLFPLHDPVSFPSSDGGNMIELSVNFEATYVIVPEDE